jgi:hypothetical protein
MSQDSNGEKLPSRIRNILINLLVLVVLYLMIRSILGWSQSDDLVIYSNFKCSCNITLPGDWVQAQSSADQVLARYEIFYFQSSPILAARSIRIFHTRITTDIEARTGQWVSSLLAALQAKNVVPADEIRFGKAGIQAESLRFERAGREALLVYFQEGENAYAIELKARRDPVEDQKLWGILETFEVIR